MLRPTLSIALLAALLAPAACRSSPSEARLNEWGRGALIHRTTRAYYVIDSAPRGKIGYVKLEDVQEGGGPTYPWRYVYDADWNELGFIDQFGGAYRYHRYSPAEAAQQNLEMRVDRLPSDSISANVLRMLGVDPATDTVTLPPATREDIAGDKGMHLAGPGVPPAKAVVAAPEGAAKPAEPTEKK